MTWLVLADAVVLLHLAFILSVVLGGFAVLLGIAYLVWAVAARRPAAAATRYCRPPG